MKKFQAIFSKLHALSDWQLWLILFAYSLGISLLIQLVLLPYVFPQWHAGNGMIIGGDFAGFHRIAAEQASAVAQFGWDSFTLYPKGQFVSGMLSIFYILIYPAPATVLPLNALLHATAGLLCFKIIYKITKEKTPSLVGASLFVLFPSALRWVSQMHNENYAVLGAVMFLFGWSQIDTFLDTKNKRSLMFAGINVFGGLLLIGLVRHYLLMLYFGVAIILSLYLIGKVLIHTRVKPNWIGIGLVVLLLFSQYVVSLSVYQPVIQLLRRGTPAVSEVVESPPEDSETAKPNVSKTDKNDGEPTADSVLNDLSEEPAKKRSWWQKTKYIPQWVENQVYQLLVKRRTVVKNWSDGKSGIDRQVELGSTVDVLLYTPRALQIALFAPFPADWFGEGAKLPSNFMRQMAALEMSLVYVLFLLAPVGLLAWRKSSTLHLMLIYSLSFLTIYAIVTPNVGNLYRFRYPFFMLLVCFSAASLVSFVSSKLRERRANQLSGNVSGSEAT